MIKWTRAKRGHGRKPEGVSASFTYDPVTGKPAAQPLVKTTLRRAAALRARRLTAQGI